MLKRDCAVAQNRLSLLCSSNRCLKFCFGTKKIIVDCDNFLKICMLQSQTSKHLDMSTGKIFTHTFVSFDMDHKIQYTSLVLISDDSGPWPR